MFGSDAVFVPYLLNIWMLYSNLTCARFEALFYAGWQMANIDGPGNPAARKNKPPFISKHHGDSYTDSTTKSQSQRERFVETARKLEVDESGETFERAFSKIVPPKNHASDCAVNNGPAYEAGPCDCGLATSAQ
jgi:hypothetical protein